MNDLIVWSAATLTPLIGQAAATNLGVPDVTAVGALGLIVWYFVTKVNKNVEDLDDTVEKQSSKIVELDAQTQQLVKAVTELVELNKQK